MDIKRCTKSFRSGPAGAKQGELYPASHPLVVKHPDLFEPVEDYVSRRFPTAPAPSPVVADTAEDTPTVRKTTTARARNKPSKGA